MVYERSDVGKALGGPAPAAVYDMATRSRSMRSRTISAWSAAFVGHGIGTEFHPAPSIPHYFDPTPTVLEPGMLFTIEPMITEGSWELGRIWPDGYRPPATDRVAAQFEHTMLVTGTGVEVLTLRPDEPRRPESAASYQLGPR